jgi:hypothetical protein
VACYVNPVPTFNLTQYLSPTEFRPEKSHSISARATSWFELLPIVYSNMAILEVIS